MLKEEKIREMIEEELLRLERFASMEKTNIYKDAIVEADRGIVRMSTLYEVLEEVPSDDAIFVIKAWKEKLN
jgi:hypothetical protein